MRDNHILKDPVLDIEAGVCANVYTGGGFWLSVYAPSATRLVAYIHIQQNTHSPLLEDKWVSLEMEKLLNW